METIFGSSVCLICFEIIEKHIFVPSDASEKLFRNCNKYLHSTLTKRILKDIKLNNENQVPLCKSCFDSALELTQLSDQLTTIEKDISDLTVAFSIAVFHRRSQVYSIGQSSKTSSIVEFNEACLPPNLFSIKIGDQNIHPSQNNQEMDINGLHLQTDISKVKCERDSTQFDNLSDNPQQSVANGDLEVKFNKENFDKQCCGQSTIEQNENIASVSEIRIVHITGRNDSKKCANPNKSVKLTMSDLLKSVKMPKIILERIKIANSNSTKPFYKCSYCEKGFPKPSTLQRHERIHTGEKPFKCSFCNNRFRQHENLKRHERIHTGEKPFKCSFCNSRFNQVSTLNRHERTHTCEKSFKCSLCDKRFHRRIQVKSHERIHTKEKPFKCSFCNKRFNNSSHLKLHERTHSDEKPFKKSHQNDLQEQMSSLISHVGNSLGILNHQDKMQSTSSMELKCSFCEMIFSHDKERANHEKIHRSEVEIVNDNLIVGI